jgi:integrase
MQVEATSTFREASEVWLSWAQTRNRKPIRPSSVPSIKSALDKWIIPNLGDLPVNRINNKSVSHLVAAMRDGGLSPKSQVTYTNLVKSIIKSLTDEDGEPLVTRTWNPSVLDLPIIGDQKQPSFCRDEVEYLLSRSHGWERMLYTLLASTGLRIGEALALTTRDIVNDGRTLNICAQIDRFGKYVQWTKTRAGIRQVDLHPSITDLLLPYADSRENGLFLRPLGIFLFPSLENTPRLSSNVQHRRLDKLTEKSWHAFRRFRNTHLRSVPALPDLITFWMGHSAKGSMTEVYSKLRENVDMRLAEAERVGLGFDPNVQSVQEPAKRLRSGRQMFVSGLSSSSS